ncbi:hypothetical protein [Nocardia asiatica]|uniref:hypothetical protein n=1 Tax=Nocardia asiatica TaxID=209252 RepID=UPI002457E9C5|nr:hypothetical protein [Nocardia asiatica]
MPVDSELLGWDLKATVLAGELRSFVLQAYTTTVLAMWALVVRDRGYVFLAPELVPLSDQLREAQWQVVMFRRHLVPALDERVLDCARLGGNGDLSRRWEPATVLEGPERKSGTVWHLPNHDKLGVVHGEGHTVERPVELGLLVPDFRSYAHCRCPSDHLVETEGEADCARLVRHERITYVPMRWVPPREREARIPIAFLTSRATPQDRPHPSGIGLTPVS